MLLHLVQCLLFHLTGQPSSVFFSTFNHCFLPLFPDMCFNHWVVWMNTEPELWYLSQRERSYPVVLPARPLEGRRASLLHNQHRLVNPCTPYSPSFLPEPPDAGMVFTQTHGPLDTIAEKIPFLGNMQPKPYSASLEDEVFQSNQVNESSQTYQVVFNNTAYMCDMCCKRNCVCKLSGSDGNKPQTSINKPALTVNETENTNLEPVFAQHMIQAALQEKEMNQRDLSNSRSQNYVVENNPFEHKCTAPPSAEKTDRHVRFEQTVKDSEEEEKMKQGSCTIPAICPRFPRGTFGYGVKRSSSDLGSDLLELQNSFSQTKAHRIFRESLQDATVDLRDNNHTGKKHFFYGFNSYHFHNWKPKIEICWKVE